MGCNCKEKKKEANVPCADATEESFRVAYRNECLKTVKSTAEAQEYKKRFEYVTLTAQKALKDMNALVTNREEYIKLILISLGTRYPDIQKELLERCGSPPISIKLGGKDNVERENGTRTQT